MPTDDPRLEQRREEVIEILTTAFAEDHISADTFESRLEIASKAGGISELESLLNDLPPAVYRSGVSTRGSYDQPVDYESSVRDIYRYNDDDVRDESSVVAILSGTDRKGLWDPPRTLNVFAFLGGSEIDLTAARLPRGGMTIKCMAFLGGVEITVPSGVNVDVQGIGILGAFEGKRPRTRIDANAPSVRVEGLALLGGVEVKYK